MFLSTNTRFTPAFTWSRLLRLRIIVTASAAAVASSSSEQFVSGSAVKSDIAVWKLNSASRRPCDISAWYGVYDVYHTGFSSMFL